MKRKFKVLLCAIFMVIWSACNNRISQLERMAEDFGKETIKIPSDLVSVFGGEISPVEFRDDRAKMVYWFDSTQCTTCNAKRLDYLDPLYSLSEDLSSFEILLIFSPAVTDVKTIESTLCYYDLAHPILLDRNQSFYKMNPIMTEYPFFQRFYMDKEGHPKFVGDPVSSESMWTIFRKVAGSK